MRYAALLPLLLAGCLAAPPPPAPSYRDADVPLSVTTRGGLSEMQGTWRVRATFPATATIERVDFAPRGDGKWEVDIHQPGCDENCHLLSGTWPAEAIAQNRVRLLTDSNDEMELWVIWVDEGIRTAVIATPDGRAAFIADRQASGGADRIQAAREVLDFNGYDTSALITR